MELLVLSKTIYIADDEENILELMSSLLKKEGFIVKTFNNGIDLLDEFYVSPANLVILDIIMPGMDGLSICALLRKLSNVPIIIVSALDSEIDKVTGITLGCDDYISKPFSHLELVARVKAIFRRIQLDQEPQVLSLDLVFGDITINEQQRSASIKGKKVNLTQTEFSLITYLIKNSNRAVSREELLRKIWNFRLKELDSRATDDAVKRLRKKLTFYNSNVAIQTVRGYGFRIFCDVDKKRT